MFMEAEEREGIQNLHKRLRSLWFSNKAIIISIHILDANHYLPIMEPYLGCPVSESLL